MPDMKRFEERMRDLVCHWFKHRIDRERVWHDTVDYRTTCQLCRRPLLREVSGWRLFDSAIDGNIARKPHPRSREPKRKIF